MKKKRRSETDDDLRPEYDLRRLLKGPFGASMQRAKYRAGTNLVLLAPIGRAFANDAEAINEALRLVLQLARIPGFKPRRTASWRSAETELAESRLPACQCEVADASFRSASTTILPRQSTALSAVRQCWPGAARAAPSCRQAPVLSVRRFAAGAKGPGQGPLC